MALWKATVLRNRATVLMYHRVLTPAQAARAGSHPGIVVTAETFAWQMALLKRHCHVLTVDEFHAGLTGARPFPPASCLITFDDGWRDNVENALPVLQRLTLPAVLFLPVGFIGRRRAFWRETLTQLAVRAVRASRSSAALREPLAAVLRPLGLAHLLDLQGDDVHAAVVSTVSDTLPATRPVSDGDLSALARVLGVSLESLVDADAFMSWDEVEAMRRGGVAIGGHGVDHRVLTTLSAGEVRAEIEGSREVVAPLAAPATLTFSYPNGYWTPEIAATARTAGYRMAFTTEAGLVSAGDDPWSVRRVNIHEAATASPAMFLSRVMGFL